MKAIKYLIAGALIMGLSAPAMAQEVNYKDMLKPIETTLKSVTLLLKNLKRRLKSIRKSSRKILRH